MAKKTPGNRQTRDGDSSPYQPSGAGQEGFERQKGLVAYRMDSNRARKPSRLTRREEREKNDSGRGTVLRLGEEKKPRQERTGSQWSGEDGSRAGKKFRKHRRGDPLTRQKRKEKQGSGISSRDPGCRKKRTRFRQKLGKSCRGLRETGEEAVVGEKLERTAR